MLNVSTRRIKEFFCSFTQFSGKCCGIHCQGGFRYEDKNNFSLFSSSNLILVCCRSVGRSTTVDERRRQTCFHPTIPLRHSQSHLISFKLFLPSHLFFLFLKCFLVSLLLWLYSFMSIRRMRLYIMM